ncbi:hypothetical protein [Streptomyces sp. NPDC006997]|uniref:hypothetical protein n=1 Tax=Streptomyces sp. NPDC006997 TaxID=3155356 RepID=UPI0033F69BF1
MPLAGDRTLDEAEVRTFLLDGLNISVFRPYRRCRTVQGVKHPAAMLGLRFLSRDGESGLYYVNSVTETPEQFHAELPNAASLTNRC